MLKGQAWTLRDVRPAWCQRKRVQVVSPAAGADWTFVAPPGYMTLVNLATALLTTSAQVATREVAVRITDGNLTLWQAPTTISAVATRAINFNGAAGLGAGGAPQLASASSTTLPELLLSPGWTLGVVTTAIQTEDQWSAIVLTTEQFEIDPAHDIQELHAMAERVELLERSLYHGTPIHPA